MTIEFFGGASTIVVMTQVVLFSSLFKHCECDAKNSRGNKR